MLDDPEQDDAVELRHEMRQKRCRACRARIIFLKTSSGKAMPVDADTVEASDDQFDHERHVSHFATCPDAPQFRRR